MSETAKATARSSIRECESHLKWIQRARMALRDRFPLGIDAMRTLEDRDVELLDQMIYRFTKMQDSLARRFLPSSYSLLEGSTDPVPFLDILNRLASLGVLPSVELWQFFRNLRNNLAHDDPESEEQTVATLNQLNERMPEFIALFETARDAISNRLE